MPPGSEAPDLTRLATDVLAAARARGVIIATAESCTGGLIIGALTEIAGSSDVVDRGFITYSNAAKTEMLGVRPRHARRLWGRSVNRWPARWPRGACAQSSAPLPADRLALAVTGIAGPGGSDHKPEGRVCFGLAYAGRGDRGGNGRVRRIGPHTGAPRHCRPCAWIGAHGAHGLGLATTDAGDPSPRPAPAPGASVPSIIYAHPAISAANLRILRNAAFFSPFAPPLPLSLPLQSRFTRCND